MRCPDSYLYRPWLLSHLANLPYAEHRHLAHTFASLSYLRHGKIGCILRQVDGRALIEAQQLGVCQPHTLLDYLSLMQTFSKACVTCRDDLLHVEVEGQRNVAASALAHTHDALLARLIIPTLGRWLCNCASMLYGRVDGHTVAIGCSEGERDNRPLLIK